MYLHYYPHARRAHPHGYGRWTAGLRVPRVLPGVAPGLARRKWKSEKEPRRSEEEDKALASNEFRPAFVPGARRVKGSGGSGGSKTMLKTVGGRQIPPLESYGRR